MDPIFVRVDCEGVERLILKRTHGWAFQLSRMSVLPTWIVVFWPRVLEVAPTDGSSFGTTIVPMSLPNEVADVPSREKPLMKAGGIRSTGKKNTISNQSYFCQLEYAYRGRTIELGEPPICPENSHACCAKRVDHIHSSSYVGHKSQ